MKQTKDERGFSLMEVVIAMMMLTLVMGAAFSLLNRFQSSYRYEEAYADAQRNGRFALARLNEIIRSAGTNPTANVTVNPTNFAVLQGTVTTSGTAKTSSSIRLKSDLNGDGLNTTNISLDSDVIVTAEDVTLKLDAATRQIIMENHVSATSVPIADSIVSLSFTDPNGATNTNKTIVVNIVAVPNGIVRGDPRYREVSYSASIRLRNR